MQLFCFGVGMFDFSQNQACTSPLHGFSSVRQVHFNTVFIFICLYIHSIEQTGFPELSVNWNTEIIFSIYSLSRSIYRSWHTWSGGHVLRKNEPYLFGQFSYRREVFYRFLQMRVRSRSGEHGVKVPG